MFRKRLSLLPEYFVKFSTFVSGKGQSFVALAVFVASVQAALESQKDAIP